MCGDSGDISKSTAAYLAKIKSHMVKTKCVQFEDMPVKWPTPLTFVFLAFQSELKALGRCFFNLFVKQHKKSTIKENSRERYSKESRLYNS